MSSAARRVVLGCDGSTPSEDAIPTAVHEAAQRGLSLLLLGLARTPPALDDLAARRAAEGMARQRARVFVKRAAELARRADPRVRVDMMVTGSLDVAAVREVAERADLLVLGGRRATVGNGSGSGLRGQVHCAHWSSVPLLVPGVDRPAPPPRLRADPRPVVVVGLPEVPSDAYLLRGATEQARRRRASVLVVHAVPLTASRALVAERVDRVWQLVRSGARTRDVAHRVSVTVKDLERAVLTEADPGDVVVLPAPSPSGAGDIVARWAEGAPPLARPFDVLLLPRPGRVADDGPAASLVEATS